MGAFDSKLFSNYWNRKQILQGSAPKFQVKKWWLSEDLCEIEDIYFTTIQKFPDVLDVGAGDLRMKKKFIKHGYTGDYHTQDINQEFQHTYNNLQQIDRTYSAILCLDVLEHMPLEEGLVFLEKLFSLLAPGGVLILQTANARCIRNPLSWDMTHRQCYSLPDLWALFTAAGLETVGFRVVFRAKRGLVAAINSLLGRFIITRLLGCDYADNIALIAKKRPQT
jgi:hypothetical protein